MKLNFFSRIYLAITDFRLYPYVVQKEKFISTLAYFIGFIILVSAVLAVNFTSKTFKWTSEFVTEYDNKISDFKVESGELILDEKMNFEFYGVQIYADDTVTAEEFDIESFDSMDCDITILGLKDAVALGNEDVGFVLAEYNESRRHAG